MPIPVSCARYYLYFLIAAHREWNPSKVIFTESSKLLMYLWGIKLSPVQDSNVINFKQNKETFHQSLEINGDRILSSKLLTKVRKRSNNLQTRGKSQALSIL